VLGWQKPKGDGMDTERVFETADLYLSAALVTLLKIQPAFKVIRGKTIFCFPATDDLYRAMSVYNAGVALSAVEYAETIKRLRAEMIMRRNAGA
jgi:hypothetical protein